MNHNTVGLRGPFYVPDLANKSAVIDAEQIRARTSQS